MRKKIGELGRTEWDLMRICWKNGKASAREILEESLKDQKRSYQTVKTMLDRLAEKGYLERERFGPIWLYSPVVTEELITFKAVDDFVETVLDNSIVPIFMRFIKNGTHKNQIKELKRLINNIDEGVGS